MNFSLSSLPNQFKKFLISILCTLTIGMTVGIYFVSLRSGVTPKQIVSHYNGNEFEEKDEFGISYGKSVSELTLTVHNHIISFTFIFIVIGLIFFGVENISPKLKSFLLIEPFISIVTTFGSMYLIRFIHPNFIYLMILSSSIMYLSYFVMVWFSFKELLKGN